MVNPRDISRPLQLFRQALFSGRVYKYNVRFEDHSLGKKFSLYIFTVFL